MDWSNEDYVRLYTRETDDDLILSWDALSVWRAMLTKFDRSGMLETRRGARGLAAILRCPFEIVERSMPELLADGRVVQVERGYFAPNFMEAQEASKSDKARQRESRARRRAHATDVGVTNRDRMSRAVTDGHEQSQTVTLTSADPDPDPDPVLCLAPARAIPPAPAELPQGWAPEHHAENLHAQLEAETRGVVAEYELAKFREYYRGKTNLDWNTRWRAWLIKAFPTPTAMREALSTVDRAKRAQAARDRERVELHEQKQRAEADREFVQRAAKAALETNFQPGLRLVAEESD